MDAAKMINECEKCALLAERYRDCCRESYIENIRKVKRFEYSVGGEAINRGYYCPSIITDIVIGNIKRGRLVKKMTFKTKPTYEYGFDENNTLLTVKKIDEHPEADEYEFIMHESEYELGIGYTDPLGLHNITERYYKNNRTDCINQYLYNSFDKTVAIQNKEIYIYGEDSLNVHWYSLYNFRHKPHIFTHDEYCFQLKDDYLTDYSVRHYNGDNAVDILTRNRIYKVRIKRKV